MVKNKFNNIDSKEWLPYQKSWFRWDSDLKTLHRSLRFFTKADLPHANVHIRSGLLSDGEVEDLCKQEKLHRHSAGTMASLQFVLLDLRADVMKCQSKADIQALVQNTLIEAKTLYERLQHRRFLAIWVQPWLNDECYFPMAWELAKQISRIYSLKDEKIGCTLEHEGAIAQQSGKGITYVLLFRKDELSENAPLPKAFLHYKPGPLNILAKKLLASDNWFILKPPPRRKNEILHPAKFPESLPARYIDLLTAPGHWIHDPMSGTGSTQVAALMLGRNATGTELSPFFAKLAQERIAYYKNLGNWSGECSIIQADARDWHKFNLPKSNYIITSPPYWDMLNMKGAEYQARRKEKGLQLNYSNDASDLGNWAAYPDFVNELAALYISLANLMQPDSVLTIVVKNIKKKGKNYPLAWDLALALQHHFELLPEQFWCQDDINLAPYGFGNTWVSNTFHQYCLHFKKLS